MKVSFFLHFLQDSVLIIFLILVFLNEIRWNTKILLNFISSLPKNIGIFWIHFLATLFSWFDNGLCKPIAHFIMACLTLSFCFLSPLKLMISIFYQMCNSQNFSSILWTYFLKRLQTCFLFLWGLTHQLVTLIPRQIWKFPGIQLRV